MSDIDFIAALQRSNAMLVLLLFKKQKELAATRAENDALKAEKYDSDPLIHYKGVASGLARYLPRD